jgi:hypothetical protein
MLNLYIEKLHRDGHVKDKNTDGPYNNIKTNLTVISREGVYWTQLPQANFEVRHPFVHSHNYFVTTVNTS